METSAFVDTTVYNEYVNFKHSIMFPIAIIRFILILAFVGIPCFLANFLPKYCYDYVIPLFCNLITFVSGFYNVPVINKHLLNINSIIVYNHSCIFDGLFLIGKIYPFTITIKEKQVKLIPGITEFSDGLIFKESGNFGGTKLIINHINLNKRPLMIAPEGTITNGTKLVDFKLGAFNPMVPVQPIILRYPNKVSVSWCDISLGLSMYNILTQFINYASIEVLPVIYPDFGETSKEFSLRTKKIMENKL